MAGGGVHSYSPELKRRQRVISFNPVLATLFKKLCHRQAQMHKQGFGNKIKLEYHSIFFVLRYHNQLSSVTVGYIGWSVSKVTLHIASLSLC